MDAAQGLEAQTLANYHLARDAGLVIVPVLNKIDLPGGRARAARRRAGARCSIAIPSDILRVSAKSGAGVPELLKAVIERVPPPGGDR